MERHAARLRAAAIDAVNLHQTEWTGGLVPRCSTGSAGWPWAGTRSTTA